MRAIIIEDEPLVAKDLRNLISKVAPEIEVLAILESVKQAKEYFQSHAFPDLIFSDIQLADGISFDIFKDSPLPSSVIFTTTYDQYAIRAFKLNSIDYLLKPIDADELKRALDKFRKQKEFSNSLFPEQFREMLSDLREDNKRKFKKRFTGHLGKTLIAVPDDQVAYFTKDAIIFLITRDNKQIITDYNSLEELEELVNPEVFYRANRQFIINLNSIEGIHPHHTGKLQIELIAPLQADITVSREKAGEFKKWFEGD